MIDERLLSLDGWLLHQIKFTEGLLDMAENKSVMHLGAGEYRLQVSERLRMLLAIEFLTKGLGPQARHQAEIILRGKKK
jgi:hypothetical protein